jgi:hypothetical protein
MTRVLVTGLAVLSLIGLAVSLALGGDAGGASGGTSTEAASATITGQRGTTEALLLNAEEWANTKIGRVYTTGTALKTGERSYIDLNLDEYNSFRIKGTTQVRVEKILETSADESGKIVKLVRLDIIDGEVNSRLDRLPDDVRVQVASPIAVAGAAGTGFTVGFDKARQLSLVKVIQSSVLVEALDRAGKNVEVAALQQIEATPWKGGKITATGRGVLSEKQLGKEFVEQFRQKPEEVVVTVTGNAPAPTDVTDKQQRQAESKQAALDAAHAKLAEVVLGLAVNEFTTVADLLAADQALAEKVYGVIAALPPAATAFDDEDSCTVTLKLDLVALDKALGQALAGTLASVEEMPKADYLAKFGARAAITTKRAAEVDAQRRLAEKIYGSVIEGGRTLDDAAQQNAQVRVTVQGVVRGAVIEEEHYFSDGSVTVVMSCPGDQIAQQHGDIVGDTFLSSPEPAALHDFEDYRAMHGAE